MKEVRINIILRISKELNIPAIAECIILNDRISEEYGDEIKTINLPYFKLKQVLYDESILLSNTIKEVNNHILQYWQDIEQSIN